MTVKLAQSATAQDTVLELDSVLTVDSDYPWWVLVDTEGMFVTGGGGTTEVSVQRGLLNSTKAAHAVGAELQPLDIGGGF